MSDLKHIARFDAPRAVPCFAPGTPDDDPANAEDIAVHLGSGSHRTLDVYTQTISGHRAVAIAMNGDGVMLWPEDAQALRDALDKALA